MKLNAIILVIATFSMVGCTTMRPVDTGAADLDEALERGDRVVVYEKSGRIADITFGYHDGEKIRGQLTDGSGPISVAVADIEQLEVEKLDGAKTTLAVVGGTIVLVPLAILALFAAAGAQGFSM